jgi:hypothetical protein
MTMMGQTDKKRNKERYFKLGGSYFTQATATEFLQLVDNNQIEIYVGGKLVSRESITGSFERVSLWWKRWIPLYRSFRLKWD